MAPMAAQHDLGPHRRMWGNFVILCVTGTAATAAALALMALFLL
jgi:hypothetical protein